MLSVLGSRWLRLAMIGFIVSTTSMGCDDDNGPNEPRPGLVTVTISPGPGSLQVGGTRQYSATVTGYEGDKAIAWQSLNEVVAAVSATGLVTAVAPGTADIVAMVSADNAIRASVRVTVTQ